MNIFLAVTLSCVRMANVIFCASQITVAQLAVGESPIPGLALVTGSAYDVWFAPKIQTQHYTEGRYCRHMHINKSISMASGKGNATVLSAHQNTLSI